MDTLIYVAIAFLAVCTLLPLWQNPHWLIRSLDFPRLQLAAFSLLLMIPTIWWAEMDSLLPWIPVLITSSCFAYHLWWIWRFTPLFPTEVEMADVSADGDTLSVLTVNVLMTNRQTDRLLELIRQHQPDLLVTLETDQFWQDALDTLEGYPHTIKCPLDNFYGMHVYSRLPLHNSRIDFLVEPDKPSMSAMLELPGGDQVRCHFLHPAPPSPTENEESSERDAELLIVARALNKEENPVLVTGDLNDVAWSKTTHLFRSISGLLDPRIGRGLFNTFHARYWFLRWPLDHLFHSQHFALRKLSRLPAFGSDHFALFAELVYHPARHAERQGPAADADDLALAEEKIQAENVDENDVPDPDK